MRANPLYRPLSRAMFVLAAVGLLASCSAKKATKSDDQRTATGQVLPGSISDAMLPYDTATSTPPVAARHASGMSSDGGDSAAGPPVADSSDAPAPETVPVGNNAPAGN